MNTNFNENNEIHHLLSAYIGQGSSQVALVVCQCRKREFHPSREDLLEEGVETHISLLAWRIP